MRIYGRKTWVGSEIGSQEKHKQSRAGFYACEITYRNLYVQICIECLKYDVSDGYLSLVDETQR